jgi:hypothetical protein
MYPVNTMQGKGPILMSSISRSQMNGTSNSSSSGFSFGDATLRRHSKEGNMVVLGDDGLSVVLIPAQPICPFAILLTLLGAKEPLQILTMPPHFCTPCALTLKPVSECFQCKQL